MELSYSGSGTVLYQEKEYRCDLYLNEDEGGVLISIFVSEAMASFIELPFEIDSLPGKLDTGFNFTAFKCYRTKMESRVSEGRSIFTFQAQSLLKGVGVDNSEGAKLYKVQFSLADVLEWGTFSEYRIGENYELLNGEPVEKRIFVDDQITVKYLVASSMLPVAEPQLLRDKIILSQEGIIEIQSNEPKEIGYFEECFRKIKRLIEISMQKSIRLTEVTGWSHNAFYDLEETHIESPISILTTEISSTAQEDNHQLRSWKWFTLPELLENNSFSLYFEKYELLEPVVELYMEAFNPNGISAKRLFLNLVQGLETYHSRFVTNDLKEFKKRISNVILKNRPEQFTKAYTAFLLAKSHSFITLESRIADLLTANFEMYFDTGTISRERFPEIISNTRNYLIHYDERIKQNKRVLTDEEISIYNKTLLSILEYYLLREVGFSDVKSLSQKLKDRWGDISTTLAIIKASRDKEKAH